MEVYEKHRALVESGRLDDAMRLSGENLASAEAALNAAVRESDEERVRRAVAFLDAGTLHLADLQYAGMIREEVATAMMIVATLIIARVNPENIPQQYVRWLQMIALRFGDAMQESGENRLMEDFARILKLAVVTADDYNARFGLDAPTMQINENIQSYLKSSGTSSITYAGKQIVPQTAIDILVNAINTLAAIGWVNDRS